MAETTQKTVAFDSSNEEKALLGSNDLYLKQIRDAFSIRVSARNQVVKLRGDAKSVDKATHVLDDMIRHYRRSQELQTEDVERYIHDARLVPSELRAANSPASAADRAVGRSLRNPSRWTASPMPISAARRPTFS